MDPRGKVAVVTGASSGIGRETALALARRGATVVGVARRGERLAELVEACRAEGAAASSLVGDLGERRFAEAIVTETLARHGRLDVLVNNAAMPMHESIYRVSADDAERVLRVNFMACVVATLAAIPAMLRQGGGAIVNVSSFATQVIPTHETLYAASKFALDGFSEGLWNDLAGSGIHVALVHPGPIETEIWSKLQRPAGFRGRRYPASLVAEGILECLERERRHMTIPRRNPLLVLGRLTKLLLPAVARAGAARVDPLRAEDLEAARRAAARTEEEKEKEEKGGP